MVIGSTLALATVIGGWLTPAASATDVAAAPPTRPAQGPPPAPVPPNRCIAEAELVSAAAGPAPETLRLRLPTPAGQRLSSLELRIHAQRPAGDPYDSLCVPDKTLRALAAHDDRSAFVGRRVEVELELIGSTERRRWWVHRLTPLTHAPPLLGEDP